MTTDKPAPLTSEARNALVDLLDYSDGHGGRPLRSRDEQEFVISTWALTERGQRFLAERAGAGRLREAELTLLIARSLHKHREGCEDADWHRLAENEADELDDHMGTARLVAADLRAALDAEPGQPTPRNWTYNGKCEVTPEDHERGEACDPLLPHSHPPGKTIKWARSISPAEPGQPR